ncbi:MAG: ABC transporter ATP-binding protein [Cyclobacteriaceae bacterium]
MRTYLRIMGFARPLGLLVPQFVIFTLLATIFSVVNISILAPVMEILFGSSSQSDCDCGEAVTEVVAEMPPLDFSIRYFVDLFYYYLNTYKVEEGVIATLYFVCSVLITSVFLANIFRYLSTLILERVRINVIENLRNKAFFAITHFDLGYFTEKRKGDIMSRVSSDVLEVETSVVSSLKVLFKEPFLIIGFFTAMFFTSPKLTLYSMILIPLSGGIISYIAKRLKRRARLTQDTLGRISNVIEESLSGMRIIKAFSAKKYITEKFSGEISNYSRHNYRMASRFNLASPISEFLGVFVVCLIILIGGSMVLSKDSSLTGSDFIVFLAFFSQVLTPAKAISNSLTTINRGLASGERIFELMDSQTKINEKPGAPAIDSFSEAIRLENVSFGYEDKLVLKNINLEIPKGKVIALVGPSGGGKSTLVDLIPRFYDPKLGAITIDGADLRDCTISGVRGLMGIVTQESILFNDTIFNNIAFGKPNATLEEVKAAARVAHADIFIEQFDEGYDTLIGERGTKLSGGQRQRLSIARAVLKNPPVLILDEATSALDSESEKYVQDAIENIMQNRTAIIIAHRLSTIQNADKIVVIKDGEILQEGTHSTLMKSGGLYKKLIEMQSF